MIVSERKKLGSFDDSKPDISAEERYYNRSVRIRRSVILFLDKNVNRKQWGDIMRMAEECANYPANHELPFASITAYRWIKQFTARNFAFKLVLSDNLSYRIARRRPLRPADFVRWGIPVPGRFRRSK